MRKTMTVAAGREEKMGDDDEDPLLSMRVVSTRGNGSGRDGWWRSEERVG